MSNLMQNIKSAAHDINHKFHEVVDPALEKAGTVVKTAASATSSVVTRAIVISTCALAILGFGAAVGCAAVFFFVSAVAIIALKGMSWCFQPLFEAFKSTNESEGQNGPSTAKSEL